MYITDPPHVRAKCACQLFSFVLHTGLSCPVGSKLFKQSLWGSPYLHHHKCQKYLITFTKLRNTGIKANPLNYFAIESRSVKFNDIRHSKQYVHLVLF